MPYLNWKEQTQLKQEIAPDATVADQASPVNKMCLSLFLDSNLLSQLLPLLRDTFENEGTSELRLDLPRGWIIFWKKREGESRLLLAHPQEDEWVSTVALSADHGLLLVQALGKLGAGQAIQLGALAETGKVSNLELALAHT